MIKTMKNLKLFLILFISITTLGACGGDNKSTSQRDSAGDINQPNSIGNIHPSTGSDRVAVARAGIEIENGTDVIHLIPVNTELVREKFWWNNAAIPQDFNNDGIIDYAWFGTFYPENVDQTGLNTGGLCGNEVCTGNMPGPVIYFGQQHGTWIYNDSFFTDNRAIPGQSSARQFLVTDFNGDGVLDVFIADHGVGTHNGFRDSYFISQPDGSLLESSETHLSDAEFVVFDHGAAAGDIDNDGDMDIVITNLSERTPFICWMNDGTGAMSKTSCGGKYAYALELGDMDGDGDLDAVIGAHENEGNFTGIAWNNGFGGFYETTALPRHEDWPTIPESSMADLDNDGDLDIVFSRAGYLYVGTAIQVIENTGTGSFTDHGILKLIEPPAGYVPTHEGNEWNDFIEAIRFFDVDEDGDKDIFLSSTSVDTNGTILMNNKGFSFSIKMPDSVDYPVTKITESSFSRY